MAAGTDALNKPAVEMPEDAPVVATPKIDLMSPSAPEPPAPAPAPAAPTPDKKDLAGYEAADAAAVKAAEARPAVMAQTAGKPKRSPILWIVLGVVVLAAAGGGGYWYLTHRSSGETASAPTPSPTASIALTSPTPSATPTPAPSPSETPSATPTPTPSAAPQPSLSLSVGGSQVANGQSISVTTNRPVFNGTAAAGSTVNLTIAPENIGLTATAASDGSWSITPSSDLPNGDHSATVSDGTSQVAFQLSVNPGSSNGSSLAQTGDPVALISLLAALALVGSLAGLRLTRRHG